jgi:hypothetical protein
MPGALASYFRGDLRPKLYDQITARLVTVVVIAYLLNALYAGRSDNRALWTAAFLAGIVPSTAPRGIGVAGAKAPTAVGDSGARKGSPARLAGGFQKACATPRALTKIDNVDLYESARLESEGVADVAALARSDLVSTMISTRLPADRLTDWTDQAILLMLLDDGADPDEPASGCWRCGASAPGRRRAWRAPPRTGRHRRGVRRSRPRSAVERPGHPCSPAWRS